MSQEDHVTALKLFMEDYGIRCVLTALHDFCDQKSFTSRGPVADVWSDLANDLNTFINSSVKGLP